MKGLKDLRYLLKYQLPAEDKNNNNKTLDVGLGSQLKEIIREIMVNRGKVVMQM